MPLSRPGRKKQEGEGEDAVTPAKAGAIWYTIIFRPSRSPLREGVTVMRKILPSVLLLLLLAGRGGAQDAMAQDQQLLQSKGIKTDGAALLEYFRERTYKEADPKDM